MTANLTNSDYISISIGIGQIATSIILAIWTIKTHAPKATKQDQSIRPVFLFFSNFIRTWPLWIPFFVSIILLKQLGNNAEVMTRSTIIQAVSLGSVICTSFLFSIFIATISTVIDIMKIIANMQAKAVQQTTEGFQILHRHLVGLSSKSSRKIKSKQPIVG